MRSYGTGSVVKLPGSAPDQPNVYEFGTTYQFMLEDLYRKDPHLYLVLPFLPPAYCRVASMNALVSVLVAVVVLFDQDLFCFFFCCWSDCCVWYKCTLFWQILACGRSCLSGQREMASVCTAYSVYW